MDFLGAIVGLVAMSPLLALVALAIKLNSEGPIFFKREVLGRNGVPFAAYKFRTMVVNADEMLKNDPRLNQDFLQHFKLKKDPRVTGVGYLLRKLSIDEIPQLLNVLRGQMSLVGPRMMTAPELERYGHWRSTVLSVRPGMSGLWQVSGRQEIPFEERILLDVRYVECISLRLDLSILLSTPRVVLSGRGAY